MTQNLGQAEVQILDVAASCSRNFPSNIPVSSQEIENINPASCPKFYQINALEIVEEYEQALADNSLEKLNNLFDKLLELSD